MAREALQDGHGAIAPAPDERALSGDYSIR
jgi:hypothetical protein